MENMKRIVWKLYLKW